MKRHPLLIRHSLLAACTLFGATLITTHDVFAQGCQGGGMGSSQGMNRAAMAAMNGFNSPGFGGMSGSMPGYTPGYMAGYQAAMAQANQQPAKSPAEKRQIVQAKYHEKAEKLRERKAANREANLTRQKSKVTKPSSSSSPTALRSSGRYGYWIV